MQNLYSKRFVLIAIGVVAALLLTAFLFLDRNRPPRDLQSDSRGSSESDGVAPKPGTVFLSDQAIANLGLRAKAAKPQLYWKSIQVPGLIVDRPGLTDRAVISPVAGMITRINHAPGATVQPGDELFVIQPLGESVHEAQTALPKATQDIRLAQAKRSRLRQAGDAIPGARLIEVDHEIARLEVMAQSSRQELANRGFSADQIDQVSEGKFAREIRVKAPDWAAGIGASSKVPEVVRPALGVQELNVELGQQVQAGQTLCLLANHQQLAVEGRAFRDETPLLERSVKENWPIEIDFQEEAGDWPPLNQTFHISQLANTIDPVNRTFAFLMPLTNESKVVQTGDRTQILWRFRPGQKARILVRVEKVDNVFVLPADAIVRDGAEAFVFTQNVNTFERKPVRVVSQDRQHAVIANDRSLLPGTFVVQNVAAQLDRMAKSKTSDVPKGYHVHADGSLHKNEDEEK